jgi:hypothetical protein
MSMKPCPSCGAASTVGTWCLSCAPSWCRVAAAVADLRRLRLKGRDVGPRSAARTFALIRYRLDGDDVVRLAAMLDPPKPVMPKLGPVVRARRVGVMETWCPGERVERAA